LVALFAGPLWWGYDWLWFMSGAILMMEQKRL